MLAGRKRRLLTEVLKEDLRTRGAADGLLETYLLADYGMATDEWISVRALVEDRTGKALIPIMRTNAGQRRV
ncbi:hypothetical protein RB195_000657 [Necator americanus]|uniref:Uncharacterized protein n=1 Tax=Necator americanus TaxID=51031 RepID=A0ABR1DC56_NECAM